MSRSVFFALLAVAFSPAFASIPVPSQLQGATCAEPAAELIQKWGSENLWSNDLNTGEGPRSSRTPTSKVAVWIETHVYPDRHVEALRITPRELTTVTWDSHGCVPRIAVKHRAVDPKRLRGMFTDDDLAQLVKGGEAGVVFAWSPQMPLSLKGVRTIRKAAEDLHLKVTLVLDPHADRASALEAARAAGLKDKDLQPMESIDLFYRGITEHYPAVVVYHQGHISSFAYPGYKEPVEYVTFLREHLK